MKKIEIEIPDDIWGILRGSNGGFEINEELTESIFKVGIFTHIRNDTAVDFPSIAEWANSQLLLETEGMTLDKLAKILLEDD